MSLVRHLPLHACTVVDLRGVPCVAVSFFGASPLGAGRPRWSPAPRVRALAPAGGARGRGGGAGPGGELGPPPPRGGSVAQRTARLTGSGAPRGDGRRPPAPPPPPPPGAPGRAAATARAGGSPSPSPAGARRPRPRHRRTLGRTRVQRHVQGVSDKLPLAQPGEGWGDGERGNEDSGGGAHARRGARGAGAPRKGRACGFR